MQKDRDQFEEVLTRFENCYQAVDVRVVCGLKENTWRSIWTRIEMRPESPGELPATESPPETETVAAVRAKLPASRAREIMDRIANGFLELKRYGIHYPGRSSGEKAKGIELTSYYLNPRRWRLELSEEASADWTVAQIRGEGVQSGDCYDDRHNLESRLRALETPYEDLADVLSSFAFYDGGNNQIPNSSTVFAVAPLMVRFGKCACDGGRMSLSLEAVPSFARKAVRIGWIECRRDGSTQRKSRDVKAADWRPSAELALFEYGVAVEPGSEISALVSVEGMNCDAVRLLEPSMMRANKRYRAHAFLDPGAARLEGYLDERKDARLVEKGLAWLLHLCGLSVGHYGETSSHDEIDLLAFSENPFVLLAVECTTSSGKVADKIPRLAARCNRLRAEVGELPVAPVLVVAEDGYEKIDQHLDAARETQAVLLDLNDVQGLLALAREGTSAKETLSSYGESVLGEDGTRASTSIRTDVHG